MNKLPEPSLPSGGGKSTVSTVRSSGRAAKWLVGLTAAILAIVSLTDYLFYRFQISEIAAKHLRLIVTGPSLLQAGVAARFDISTTEVTEAPVSVPVEVDLYSPEGQRLLGRKESTDQQGRLQVLVPADMALPASVTLKVVALQHGSREEMSVPLAVDATRFITHLSLDKPLYQPGETIFYRSLTLSRFGLAIDREMPIRFEILDPGGAVVANSQNEGVTDHGVGNGAFVIPDDLAGGQYTLMARGLDGSFPPDKQDFFIRRYRQPRFQYKLEFFRESYAPGETVEADFSARRGDGGPAARVKLRIFATVDDQKVMEKNLQTNDQGTLKIELKVPEKIAFGNGQLTVTIDDGAAKETITKAIPINLGKVNVDFYPEGGELAAGLENRVYFLSRDPLGRPVHITGMVVNDNGQATSEVETVYEGLGLFSFTPRPGESYRLKIITPPDIKEEVKLPGVATDCPIVLTTGTGIFGPGEPLEFNIRSFKAGLPLVVGAWCRGVLVGQVALVTKKNENGMNPVVLQLPEGIGGVIRLTVFDYSVNLGQRNPPGPKPLAERLVYRRLDRQLHVQLADHKPTYTPGDKVNLSLLVTNEKHEAVAAALAVSVVDDALLNGAEKHIPHMPTHFLLASEIENPEDLENADFFLSEDKTGPVPPAVALDLLLGTQGWRRFVEKTWQQIKEEGPEKEQIARLMAINGRAGPPTVYDNLGRIRADYQKSLAAYHARQSKYHSLAITISFLAALGLLVLSTMLGLLRIVRGGSSWWFGLDAGACCVITGASLLNSQHFAGDNKQAAAFLPYHAPAQAIATKQTPPEPAVKKESGKNIGLPEAGRQWKWASAGLPGRTAADEQSAPGRDHRESKNLDKERQALNQELARRKLPELSKLDAKQWEQYRFVVRQYAHEHITGQPGVRNDFAETLFWHPLLIAGADGKVSVSFDLSDLVTTFRLSADAHGDGRIGSAQAEISTKK